MIYGYVGSAALVILGSVLVLTWLLLDSADRKQRNAMRKAVRDLARPGGQQVSGQKGSR